MAGFIGENIKVQKTKSAYFERFTLLAVRTARLSHSCQIVVIAKGGNASTLN